MTTATEKANARIGELVRDGKTIFYAMLADNVTVVNENREEVFAYVLAEENAKRPVFEHNTYEYGKPNSFRIGYTAYDVWTMKGFYRDALKLAAINQLKYGWVPASYLSSFEVFAKEQRTRGMYSDMGASPVAAIMTSNHEDNRKRMEAFDRLPELNFGDVVTVEGIEVVVTRDHNNHVKFVPVV